MAGDIFKMLNHRLLRRLLVVAPDGVQDAAVAFERDPRPLDGSEQPRLRVLQQVVDDLHYSLHDGVVRRPREEVVELRVLLRTRLTVGRMLFLSAYDVF